MTDVFYHTVASLIQRRLRRPNMAARTKVDTSQGNADHIIRATSDTKTKYPKPSLRQGAWIFLDMRFIIKMTLGIIRKRRQMGTCLIFSRTNLSAIQVIKRIHQANQSKPAITSPKKISSSRMTGTAKSQRHDAVLIWLRFSLISNLSNTQATTANPATSQNK